MFKVKKRFEADSPREKRDIDRKLEKLAKAFDLARDVRFGDLLGGIESQQDFKNMAKDRSVGFLLDFDDYVGYQWDALPRFEGSLQSKEFKEYTKKRKRLENILEWNR